MESNTVTHSFVHRDRSLSEVLSVASHTAIKYNLRSLQPLIEACRSLTKASELRIAVFGRFKAGKTSFLNHFLNIDLLPVGVIPVTSVLTEIGYGPQKEALVHFLDGRVERIDVEKIRLFIAERDNPSTAKRVVSVKINLPSLESFCGIRFVDTPGLESVLTHNTETTLAWLPNVDLALVAVGVDPPLSQHDIDLIQSLYQYTPHVSLLLTKVDTLNAAELVEVQTFITERLGSSLTEAPQILPYSDRPGFEQLRNNPAETVVRKTLTTLSESRAEIINRKIDKLLGECEGYLLVALSTASRTDAERELLRKSVLGDRHWIDEAKMQLKLIAWHSSEGLRQIIARDLERYQPEIEQKLIGELRARFPGWARSLGCVITSFREWLNESLAARLQRVSVSNQEQIRAPIEKVRSQLVHCLEDFRKRLSDSANRVLGVPLPRTDVEICCLAPKRPDIQVGRVFDHEWQLLGPLVPMSLVKRWIRRHLVQKKVPYEVYKNLSRLTSQWEESVRASISALEKTAEQQLDDLVETVTSVLSRTTPEVPPLLADLNRIRSMRGLDAGSHLDPCSGATAPAPQVSGLFADDKTRLPKVAS